MACPVGVSATFCAVAGHRFAFAFAFACLLVRVCVSSRSHSRLYSRSHSVPVPQDVRLLHPIATSQITVMATWRDERQVVQRSISLFVFALIRPACSAANHRAAALRGRRFLHVRNVHS